MGVPDNYYCSERIGWRPCTRRRRSLADSVWEVFGPLLVPEVHVPVVMVQNAKHVDALVQELAACKVSRLTADGSGCTREALGRIPASAGQILEGHEQGPRQRSFTSIWLSVGTELASTALQNWKESSAGRPQ